MIHSLSRTLAQQQDRQTDTVPLSRGSGWAHRAPVRTVQELRALDVALLHLLTLVCSGLDVTDGGGKDSGSTLHQLLAEVDTVARGGTVQWCPRSRRETVRNHPLLCDATL